MVKSWFAVIRKVAGQLSRPIPLVRLAFTRLTRFQYLNFAQQGAAFQFQRSGTPRTRMARGWNSARRASVLSWPGRDVLAEALQWNTILSESGSRVASPSICLGKWNSTRGSSCSVLSKKRTLSRSSVVPLVNSRNTVSCKSSLCPVECAAVHFLQTQEHNPPVHPPEAALPSTRDFSTG